MPQNDIFDTDAAAEGLWKRRLTCRSFITPTENFVSRKPDSGMEEKSTVWPLYRRSCSMQYRHLKMMANDH